MTILTNKLDLPEALVAAVASDDYDPGLSDISVTGLLQPPLMSVLRHAHNEKIVEDASDRLWSLYGQIVHAILDKGNANELSETRFYKDILGWKVGGKIDTLHLSKQVLSDYKFVSVWKFKDGLPKEFIEQQNCYVELLDENMFHVSSARIVALLRDWSKPEASRNPHYPQSGVLTFDVPIWPKEQRIEFLDQRVKLHQQARADFASGKEVPTCTDEERWRKPTKYAVVKHGSKRATKLFDTLTEAEVLKKTGPYSIEIRAGEDTRCSFYCAAAKFCPYGQSVLALNSTEGIEVSKLP